MTAGVVQRELVRPSDTHQLLFTDVLYEDADAYRFLIEGGLQVFGRTANWVPAAEDFPDYKVAEDVPITEYAGNPAWRTFLAQLRERAAEALPELTWIVEGRDPWEIYRDERFLGNSQRDPCSKVAKRQMLDRWRAAHCDPATTISYFGIGTGERHRYDDGEGHGIRPIMAAKGWRAEAPLIDRPEGDTHPSIYMRRVGIKPPRLYSWSSHNNCGGMCCKAGQGHWRKRLQFMPERFWYDAVMEAKIAAYLDGNFTFLRDRRGGKTTPITLIDFGVRTAADPGFTLGPIEEGDDGCGCMVTE